MDGFVQNVRSLERLVNNHKKHGQISKKREKHGQVWGIWGV